MPCVHSNGLRELAGWHRIRECLTSGHESREYMFEFIERGGVDGERMFLCLILYYKVV